MRRTATAPTMAQDANARSDLGAGGAVVGGHRDGRAYRPRPPGCLQGGSLGQQITAVLSWRGGVKVPVAGQLRVRPRYSEMRGVFLEKEDLQVLQATPFF
jgi:hypothetical protein